MNIINELNSSKVVIRKIHESEIDALLMNYDYNEQGLLEFMYEDFINAVFDYIPEYALGEQALPKKTNDIVSKVREAAKSILKLKHIEKLIVYFNNDIPFNDWDEEVRAYYNSKGVLGELVFHFILREFVGTVPLISKIYFKDTFEQEAHGFDVVHIKDEELWLGESKFYESGKQGVDELIKDLTRHFNKDYLSEQFIIINRNLSASTNKSIADVWIKKLSGAVCIKDVCSYINIPLFCLYSEKSLSELNIKSPKDYDANYLDKIVKLYDYYSKNNNFMFKDKFNITLYLFPIESKRKLVALMLKKNIVVPKLIKENDCRVYIEYKKFNSRCAFPISQKDWKIA